MASHWFQKITLMLVAGSLSPFLCAQTVESSEKVLQDLTANYVTQVELNGIHIEDDVPISLMSQIFPEQYTLKSKLYQTATGDLHIYFSNEFSNLVFLTAFAGLPEKDQEILNEEFAEEITGSLHWDQLLKQDGGSWLFESGLLGSWDINWFALDRFNSELKLDGILISPKLTQQEFFKMFPTSAQSESLCHGNQDNNNVLTYCVAIASEDEDGNIYCDLPAYCDHFAFTFEGGQLIRIQLNRGIRY